MSTEPLRTETVTRPAPTTTRKIAGQVALALALIIVAAIVSKCGG